MLKQIITLFILVCVVTLQAQQKADSAKGPQPFNWKNVATWKSIGFNVAISPDGNWVAYPLLAREADGELIVQHVKDTTQRKYNIGSTAFAEYQFSEDGKWIAFREYSSFSDQKAAKKSPGKQLFNKLHLVELASGKKTTIEKAGAFSFNGKSASLLAVTIAKDNSNKSAGSDLLLLTLSTGRMQNIGNTGEFAFNKNGDQLAYATEAVDKAGNGLQLLDIPLQKTTILDNDTVSYKSISWVEDGNAFAALKMKKDEKFKTEKGSVIGIKLVQKIPQVFHYNPAEDSLGFPKGYTVSGNRGPYWSEDQTRLFFGISRLEPVTKTVADSTTKDSTKTAVLSDSAKLANLKKDTAIKSVADLKKALEKMETANKQTAAAPKKNEADKPDMTIWHWKDKRLQSRQQVQEQRDKNFSYVGIYNVTAKKFIQLNDSTAEQIIVLPKHQYALAADIRDYELDMNLDGQDYQDVYIIDANSGEKTLFAKKMYLPGFNSSPRPSPDGTKFIYGKDGHFYVYNIATGSSSNITEKIPVSFIDTEDDHNVEKPLTNLLGWSNDNKYVLINDLWDIWQVPVNTHTAAVNLTQNGRRDKIRYQFRYITDPDEKGYDVKKPAYIRAYGENTKKMGIVRIDAGKNGLQAGVKQLVWDDILVRNFSKAKHTNAFLYAKEKFNQPTEYFVSNESFGDARQVTKNTPDAGKYIWSAGVQLVDYISDKGDSLQGALFLPAGYEKGKKYPTIVYYYERMSQSLHQYSSPDYPGGAWHPNVYTSNGYAVFMPDIVYTLDDPGMSAVWCVLPAVKAAMQTGVIDENAIGIQGHSWGGYQTCFLATQTNMFKAAAAGAPLTNLVSMYDLIYWNAGIGNMPIFESSQGRFRGGPWENWDAYLRNSPVYHVKKVTTPILLMHNDKDGAVDFTQGIEFYSALRRLKKPVILLQYKGENHGLMKMENRKDYAVRMMQFFDHYLKGKPAPVWMKDGIEKLKLEDHLEKTAF
ncbi:MAG: S9 family peptidase [Chitinophagaceae bacterium]|nr:S9 family peptidase [Chitinophagaceae bacterium]MCW5926910.1 S9 family peptidase [Chitinophagaceae bacterium]